jgi:hypothetical protein
MNEWRPAVAALKEVTMTFRLSVTRRANGNVVIAAVLAASLLFAAFVSPTAFAADNETASVGGLHQLQFPKRSP